MFCSLPNNRCEPYSNSRFLIFLNNLFLAKIYDIHLLKDEKYLVMKPTEHNSSVSKDKTLNCKVLV